MHLEIFLVGIWSWTQQFRQLHVAHMRKQSRKLASTGSFEAEIGINSIENPIGWKKVYLVSQYRVNSICVFDLISRCNPERENQNQYRQSKW